MNDLTTSELVAKTEKLEAQVNALIANNNALLARQTAVAALLQTVLWGWGKSRKEVGDEILRSGHASLASVNELPEAMQREVVAIWNTGYAKLMGPSSEAFQVGQTSK